MPPAAGVLALVAHECRGAMGALLGNLSLIGRESATWTEDQRAALDGARRAAGAIVTLADQMTDIHRWLELAERESSVHYPVSDLCVMLHEVAGRCQHLCDVLVSPVATPLPWSGDPVAVGDVLHLSVARLIRLHPDVREISVSAEREADGRARVVLQPTHVTTASATRVRCDLSHGSLGLGMLRIAAIVAAHRGDIVDLTIDGRPVGMEVRLPLA